MDMETLDATTDGLTSRLRLLSAKSVAVFSACVSERLSDFHHAFALKHGLKDKSVVRNALDAVWQFLTSDRDGQTLRSHLAEVERSTPSSEDYDSVESVLAQNLCIAVDSTIRWCLAEQNIDPVAGEFGIEALRSAVSHVETGFIDVGSGPESHDFLAKLVSHPVISNEIELERSDLPALESNPSQEAELILQLKRSAESNRIDTSRLLER